MVEAGETPAKAAWREVWEECAYRLGDVGRILMRRVRDGVDFTTFLCDVLDEFLPRLNSEHSAYIWIDSLSALEEGGAVRADSADDLSYGLEALDAPASLADEEDGDLDDFDEDAVLAAIENLETRLSEIEDCRLD